MKLFKELVATLFTAVGLMLALSVVQGWNWPLLGDARAGIIALGVVGFGACITSGSAADSFEIKNPFVVAATLAGVVVLVAGVIGLFTNAMPYLVAMMVATVVIWLLATTRHLVEVDSNMRPVPAA